MQLTWNKLKIYSFICYKAQLGKNDYRQLSYAYKIFYERPINAGTHLAKT